MVLGILLAGICLLRVLTVAAAERRGSRDTGDIEEVYSNDSESTEEDEAEAYRSTEDQERAEVRFTRPEDAATRVADQGYDQVPGAERLAHDGLLVPVKEGRKIASVPLLTPASASARPRPSGDVATVRSTAENEIVPTRPEESEGETLAASPMEPRPAHAGAVGQEISVIVSESGYYPSRIFVTQNVPVKLYLTTSSKATLCLMVDKWGLKKGVAPGRIEEVAFVPDQPGNYRFYCPVKSIEGTITVREAQTSPRNLASASDESSEADAASASQEEEKKEYNTPKNARELRSLIEE